MTHVSVADRVVRLTYCTNVHPAESLDGVRRSLEQVAVRVAGNAAPSQPFGLGLWLASDVVDELLGGGLAGFRDFLAAHGLFVFTLNAFPYRGFHEARVKERVFAPGWHEAARRDYTERCAEVLAALLPEHGDGSISTVPLGLDGPAFRRGVAIDNLRRVADHLAALEGRTGRRIVLGIEPEPLALLSTIDAAAQFLDDEVFAGAADARRRHLGVCFDTCHEAVMHRDMIASLRELDRRGIAIAKVQVTSALELREPQAVAGRRRLAQFDEGRYFHQTAYRRPDGSLCAYRELTEFLAAAERPGELAGVDKVRVHFHVPVFAELAGQLRTTRAELAAFLAVAARAPSCTQFEVETYTFDVIPPAERAALGAGDLAALLAAEIDWTRRALQA